MIYPGADRFLPETLRISALRRAARTCQGCDLYEAATQVVFGAGLVKSRMMLVGEQPGDVEDRRGEPFVGPAGQVLDRALDAAGIERSDVYLTNAVKHFRWKATESTSRRLHATPTARHIAACRPWLTAELRAIRPNALVALGSVASQSLFGPGFRLTQHRGELLPWPPPAGPYVDSPESIDIVLATIHPSAVLRADDRSRREMLDGLVRDLRQVAEAL
jgi:uracil-DNA glycosylase family protein